jgi:hypothetical protein
MRVMAIVKGTEEWEAGTPPDERFLAAMGQYNESLVKAGVLLASEGLHTSSKGARVRFTAGTRTVTDGPFTAGAGRRVCARRVSPALGRRSR